MGAHVTGSRQAGLRDEGFRRRLSFSEALGSFERVLAALPTPRTKGLGKKKCWLQMASPRHLKCWEC